MFFRLFVIYLLIRAVQLAPVDDKSTELLFDIVQNDSRASNILQRRFVKFECSKGVEISDSMCIALYDLALKFDSNQLSFINSSIEADSEICSKLISTLPDKPDEVTSANIKKNYKHEVVWIKDVFLQNDGQKCSDECTYKIPNYDDELKVKPVCFFIYNQYKFLASQSTKQQQIQPKSSSSLSTSEAVKAIKSSSDDSAKTETKPVTTQVELSKDVASAFIPILPANLVEPLIANATAKSEPEKSESKEQTVEGNQQSQPQQAQNPLKSLESSEAKPSDDKPMTPPAAAVVNKSTEVTQPKLDTVKSDVTINAEDAQQTLPDNDIFNEETQSEFPNKEEDIDGNDGTNDLEEDDDGEYPQPDLVRDNNRNNHLNDVEAPETDSRVRVESVVFEENADSNFFSYLCAVMFISILLYILYHNRHKIMALLLEGRRGSRRQRERSRGGSKAAYSKLDCNLEEAITSKKSLSGKTMDIIY